MLTRIEKNVQKSHISDNTTICISQLPTIITFELNDVQIFSANLYDSIEKLNIINLNLN